MSPSEQIVCYSIIGVGVGAIGVGFGIDRWFAHQINKLRRENDARRDQDRQTTH